MVRWLDPHQLVDTAVRVLLSGVFSAYADYRELQALEPAEIPDRSGQADLWLDYVADLGDGWNSTYTVARLLATEGLKLDWDGETHATERGRILVMGGDQVYPVPKAAEYQNRMLGPYRAALLLGGAETPWVWRIRPATRLKSSRAMAKRPRSGDRRPGLEAEGKTDQAKGNLKQAGEKITSAPFG